MKVKIAEESLDKGYISDRFFKLASLIQEIKIIDDDIIDLMVHDSDQCDEESINKEVEEN